MTTELVARLPTDQLGGARVFRPCVINGKKYGPGETIAGEVLAGMPRQNLRALMDQRFIVAYPTPPAGGPAPVAADEEVYVYNRLGTPTYDVIVGKKLNALPLKKADAEALAKSRRKADVA